MRSICDLFRLVQDSWAENSSRIDTLHPWHDARTGGANPATLGALVVYFYTTGHVTGQHLQYGRLRAARSFPRHIFSPRYSAYLKIHVWRYTSVQIEDVFISTELQRSLICQPLWCLWVAFNQMSAMWSTVHLAIIHPSVIYRYVPWQAGAYPG